jgi:nicotinamide-nucleotide amidase
MRNAEIIAIGSELLTPFRSDTNSLYLTRTLEEIGVQVVAKTIIGDNLRDLLFALQTATVRSDFIICSGGLGPTVDDITKEALAEFLQVPMYFHQETWERIEERFRKRGYKIPKSNRRQAMIPEGAQILNNSLGTAPGVYARHNEKHYILLPGPPYELQAMWEERVLPLLEKQNPLERKIFRMAMMPESHVDEMLKPVTQSLQDVQYTILTSAGEIEIHLLAPSSSASELVSAAAEVRAIMGNKIFSEDAKTLEEVVGDLLKQAGKKVAVAESCTGGLLAERFTNVPGSSAYFERGFVTYSNAAKIDLLHVPVQLIEEHGAVSEPVAKAMAEGARAGVDYALAITGIAGPEGGTPKKPIGTVFIALADQAKETICREYNFPGDRNRIRYFSSQGALNLLRLRLIDEQ